MTFERSMGKRYWGRKLIFIPLFIAAAIFVFGSIVMLLWNAILPTVLGVSTITFWQALGILVLSKILFGGFNGRRRCRGYRGSRHELWQKWNDMSPEEKEKMRNELKSRFKPADEAE
jgi:Ca2+/H+ antiporter, TMEM165/GDT1 family